MTNKSAFVRQIGMKSLAFHPFVLFKVVFLKWGLGLPVVIHCRSPLQIESPPVNTVGFLFYFGFGKLWLSTPS